MRTPPDSEAELLERLRAGEEEAFLVLVDLHQATMLRLARSFVPSAQVAVARHGRLVAFETYGDATNDSRYITQSVGRNVVAAAVWK